MRVGFVSACQAFDLYLIREIHARWPLAALVQVEWPASRTSLPLHKLRRPFRATWSRVRRLQRERHEAALNHAVSQVLFGSPVPPALPIPPLTVSNREVNGARIINALKEASLDIVIVSAAPILQPDVYGQAKYGSVNVHRGFAPEYRGEDTLFWAMYFADYEQVAVTVHRIDEGVDTGPILGHGFPRLEPGYSEGRILAEAAKVSRLILFELLERLERGPVQGSLQNRPGRLFRKRDRALWHSLTAQSRIRRNPPRAREARIESHMSEGPMPGPLRSADG